MGSQVQDGCPAADSQGMCNSRFRNQGCELRVTHGPRGDAAVAQHSEGAMPTQSPKSHLVLDLEHVVHAERLLRSVAPHVLAYHLVQLLSKRLCQAICQSLSHDVGVIVTRLQINTIVQRVSTQQERRALPQRHSMVSSEGEWRCGNLLSHLLELVDDVLQTQASSAGKHAHVILHP